MEIITFFKNNANGLMYLMCLFLAMLFIFSYLSLPAKNNTNTVTNPPVLTYGKNIMYSFLLIVILLFLFSLLGYSSAYSFSSSTASSSSPTFFGWFTGTDTYKFFSANGISILNVVIIFLMFIVMFSMVGIDFNPPQNKRIKKVVEIEGFMDIIYDPRDNESGCNSLKSKQNCISSSLCGWLNDEKCVGGGINNHSPNYYSDPQGKPLEVTSWCTSDGCSEKKKKKIEKLLSFPFFASKK